MVSRTVGISGGRLIYKTVWPSARYMKIELSFIESFLYIKLIKIHLLRNLEFKINSWKLQQILKRQQLETDILLTMLILIQPICIYFQYNSIVVYVLQLNELHITVDK